jgi:hypothetical protein
MNHGNPKSHQMRQDDNDRLRRKFEAQAVDSCGLRRSRRGTYVNPAIARDWKWFQLGAQAAKE